MGLDIVFNARSKLDSRYKEEVGYFGKVNFLLTYFDIDDDHNCDSIEISHDKLHSFVNDLHKELIYHNINNTTIPVNQKFETKKVFFGGNTEYNNSYWESLRSVYNWAKDLDTSSKFNWDKDNLEMFFSW